MIYSHIYSTIEFDSDDLENGFLSFKINAFYVIKSMSFSEGKNKTLKESISNVCVCAGKVIVFCVLLAICQW